MATNAKTARRDDQDYYRELYESMAVLPEWAKRVSDAAALIAKHRQYYTLAARECASVPAVFLGLLHFRERGCNFKYQLLNGEAWNVKTKLVPAGQGPFASWQDAATYGMRHWKLTEIDDWSIGRILMETEDWNGEGYELQNLNSPYNWRGTQHAVGVGKYTSDGKYNLDAVDKQAGCAPVLRQLLADKVWVI